MTASLPSASRTCCIADQRAERVAVGVLVGDEHEARRRRAARRGPPRATAVGRSTVAHARPARLDELRSRRCARARPCRRRRTQRRRVLEPQLAADAALQEAVRGPQRLERALALARVAEHADVDARVAQVRAGLDSGDGHESDAGVLQTREVITSVKTSLMASLTRRIRSPVILVPPGRSTMPAAAPRARPAGGGRPARAPRVSAACAAPARRCRPRCDGEGRALPGVLVVDLGHGDAGARAAAP